MSDTIFTEASSPPSDIPSDIPIIVYDYDLCISSPNGSEIVLRRTPGGEVLSSVSTSILSSIIQFESFTSYKYVIKGKVLDIGILYI